MGSKCCKRKNGENLQTRDIKESIENKTKLCLWILGGPGSGKGTQCEMLALRFKLAHLSPGDILRAEVKKGGPLAEELRATMAKGKLVDTPLVLKLLAQAMDDKYDSCAGYLIDGYPRTIEQGELFCQQLGSPHMIIFLDCPDSILMERSLKRGMATGREDDNKETLKTRLQVFHDISEPVIARWKNKVVTIDASLPPMDVEKECARVIENLEENQRS